jgi:hypothetical protein
MQYQDSRHDNDRAIHELRDDVDTLYKTVYQGNGEPALTTQVSKLEHRINTLESKLDANFKSIDTEISLKFKNVTDVVNEKFNYISYQIAQEFEKKRSESSGVWGFRSSLTTATIAGICSILAIIISEFVKRM